jgi:tubulin delta
VITSLAGGTGSGLGAHVVESLRDDFSAKAPMLNFSVWPYSTGEVILQNYNVLLTLNSLLTHSDGVIPLFNDDMLSACKNLLKIPRPSYKIMNTIIA